MAIGNEAVFTHAPTQKLGLTGMDLLRLALERAANAEEAVATIIELLGRHGQGGGCGHEHRGLTYDNSFIVADRREAFVVETAGRESAVERVTNGARSISNGLTIVEFAKGRSQRIRPHFARSRDRQAFTQECASRARAGVRSACPPHLDSDQSRPLPGSDTKVAGSTGSRRAASGLRPAARASGTDR